MVTEPALSYMFSERCRPQNRNDYLLDIDHNLNQGSVDSGNRSLIIRALFPSSWRMKKIPFIDGGNALNGGTQIQTTL